MRIGWATPFNVRSAIGKFSHVVCQELRTRGHDIEIIRIESGSELKLDAIESDFAVIDAAKFTEDEHDILVVNLGNHAPYHARAVALMAKRTSIGIFHDMEMRDFEWGLLHRHGLTLPRLLGIDPELAGSGLSDMVDREARAVLAALAAMTSGAVIHGPHYLETVSAYCPGPVSVIPLCFPDSGSKRAPLPLRAGRRVTIFGHINDNKQPGRVLEAIALLQPRLGAIDLHLAGAVDDRRRDALIAQAKELGVKKPIFHGYVTDEVLQETIENSHAVCCLRYPVTEGGSASLVTALYRGRPLIVSDIASYSMVPDALVHKVSYGESPLDVAEVLMDIFSNQEQADAKALRAQEWAKDQFSAAAYVDALDPILNSDRSHELLVTTARKLTAAIVTRGQEPPLPSVAAFVSVLDWMEEGRK